MSEARARIQLTNTARTVDKLVGEFAAFARRNRLPIEVEREMHLAIDEIVSNILRHGCEKGRRHRISVEMAIEAGRLRVDVLDDARPFNVLAIKDPPLDQPLGDRVPGGLGIYLVRKLMDGLDYSRHDGWNHVVLEKRLPGLAAERAIEPVRPRARRKGASPGSKRVR